MNVTDRRSAHKKPTRFAKKSATRHTYSYMNTVTHREPQHSKIKLKCTKKHRWFSTVDRKEHITSHRTTTTTKNTLKYTYIDCNYNHQKCMMLNFVYDVFFGCCCSCANGFGLSKRQANISIWFAVGDSLDHNLFCVYILDHIINATTKWNCIKFIWKSVCAQCEIYRTFIENGTITWTGCWLSHEIAHINMKKNLKE